MDHPIYMDHHATTPLDPRVLEAMMPYLTTAFGNASSIDHLHGVEAARAVDKARAQVAELIGAQPREIVFTSGATEADNLAILGVASRCQGPGHMITCVTEHPAVLDPMRRLKELGWRITELPVDRYGLVDPSDVRAAVCQDTVLISIMAANNEIGTLAPLAEIGRLAQDRDVVFHTDAAQAVGHIPVRVGNGIDLLSMSAHKCYGPKGAGALYVNRSARPRLGPIMHGGGHERGLRSGTLNVPGVVGLGAAMAIAGDEMLSDAERERELCAYMLQRLSAELGAELNGHPERRLPHNLNVYLPQVDAKSLIMKVRHISISSGSACSTAESKPSHVLMAISSDRSRALQSIRVGIGRANTAAQIETATDAIIAASRSLVRYGT